MNKQIGENMKKQISTLENIDIRSIWKKESSDFTPWLAENINRLGDVIDMDLTVIEEEKPVGVFSSDIFCKDSTGVWSLTNTFSFFALITEGGVAIFVSMPVSIFEKFN